MAKSKSPKRDDDLFSQLRNAGLSKSAAEHIAKASAGLASGRKKAEKGIRDAADNLRTLAAELEKRLPIGNAKKAEAEDAAAGARATATKAAATSGAAARKTKAATKSAGSAAKSSAKSTDRSAAAKKAAATRKRNAAKRSAAAKKGAAARNSEG